MQIAEFVLRFDDFTLKCVILFLRDVTVCKCRICLFCGSFESVQLFLGRSDRIRKQLMLLGEQFGVGRVKLQQLFYIFELCLSGLNVFIDAFKSLRKLSGIAVDFNGDAFDSVCHGVTSFLWMLT